MVLEYHVLEAQGVKAVELFENSDTLDKTLSRARGIGIAV